MVTERASFRVMAWFRVKARFRVMVRFRATCEQVVRVGFALYKSYIRVYKK